MKKIVVVCIAILMGVNVFSQGNKTLAVKSSPHLKVFNQAVSCGDINTAVYALNYYISEQGITTPYTDTLAMLYLQQNAFVQCHYWTDKRLQMNPNDNGLLEMKGICLDKMQQPKEAIAIFEKLYTKTQSPYHAYKLMELQYGIKRLAECLATASSAERLQYKPEYTMTYNVGDQVGRTYLQASIYNIHALALYDMDKKAEAKAYFEKAVALDSNFVLARQNLEAIKSLEAGTNKIDANNPSAQPSPANKQEKN